MSRPSDAEAAETRLHVLRLRERGFVITHIAGIVGITPRRVAEILAEARARYKADRRQRLDRDHDERRRSRYRRAP